MIEDVQKRLAFKKLFRSYSDDWIDKLNHSYTTTILVLYAIMVASKQYVGDPIHCWIPKELDKDFYTNYVKSYCWIKNTYFVPMSYSIPLDVAERMDAEITYYQWVPIFFLFMAFLFKFPNVVWKVLSNSSGFNFKNAEILMGKAYEGKRRVYIDAVDNLAFVMDKWRRTNRLYKENPTFFSRISGKLSRIFCIYCSKRQGTFLSALYINLKMLYIVNVIGQFYLLNAFLGMDYSTYGLSILGGLANGVNWPESRTFPRVTLCDFQIRQLQNIQRFTVQCVLPINLFTEKMFVVFWFWLFFLAVLSGINLCKWFYLLILKRNNYKFVKNYLKTRPNNGNTGDLDKRSVRKFANKYLRNITGDDRRTGRPAIMDEERVKSMESTINEDPRVKSCCLCGACDMLKSVPFDFKCLIYPYIQNCCAWYTFSKDDGCFILRIIGMNTSDLIVMDLVEKLWQAYKVDPTVSRPFLNWAEIDTTRDNEGIELETEQKSIYEDENKDIPFIDDSLDGEKEE